MLNFNISYGCISCDRLCEKISRNKSLFILFLVFIILNGGTLGYLFYYTFSNINQMNESIITLSLVVGSFIFLGLTLLLTVFYFASDYFIDKSWVLKSYEAKRNVRKSVANSRYQVAPMSVQ